MVRHNDVGSRVSQGCGAVVPKKALLSMLPRGIESTPDEVLRALNVALPLPHEAPCMNPRCTRMCAWPASSGRPQDFCSKTCRQQCYRTLEKLRADLEALESVIEGGSGTQSDQAALRSEVAKLRWWIRRYPAPPSARTDAPPPKHQPSRVPPERVRRKNRKTLEVLLASEPPDASMESVITMLEDECVKPLAAYRCMNPECTEMCRFPPQGSQGGRPQRFCSRRCRQIFDRVRDRLLREEQDLTQILQNRESTRRQRAAVQREIALRRWALVRYPKVD